MTLHIDIASDIVCPWCYIGKRHLEAALEMYADEYPNAPAPTLAWLPFQLNPDMPPEGMSREEYVERKFGRPAHEVYGKRPANPILTPSTRLRYTVSIPGAQRWGSSSCRREFGQVGSLVRMSLR